MSSTGARQFLSAISGSFILRTLTRGDLRAAAGEALTETERWQQRDCPLKPLLIIWLVVAMAFYRTLSIPNAFRRLLDGSGEFPSRPVTPEALWRARERLGPKPVRLIFQKLARQHRRAGVAPSFLGFRLYGVDGVYFTVPDTPANVAAFGRKGSDRGEAAYPQMLGVFMVGLSDHRLLDCEWSDCHGSEGDAVYRLLKQLGEGDLIMMDRGISSYRLFLRCLQLGVSFIARVSSSWKPDIGKKLGVGDHLIRLKPGRDERRSMEKEGLEAPVIQARLITFRIGDAENGDIARVVTNLRDPAKYPALELAKGYHQRWECELTYKEMKGYLTAVTHGKQATTFRSKRPEGCQQEFWGLALTYNLIRDVMAEAARTCDPPISPLQLSFVDTVEVLKLHQAALQAAAPQQLGILFGQLLAKIAACRIDRPRRKRVYPRKVKRKMSNFQKKGPEDKQILRDFAAEIRLV